MTHGDGEDRGRRILIIDDAEDTHVLLRKKLGDGGYEVLSAYDGREGLSVARSTDVALILLDLDMPTMDGFEVLRELKDDESLMHTPVIVLSGSNNAQDMITGLELGAVDFVPKPFDFAELRARVRSALRIYKLMGMLAQRAQIDGLTGLWNRAHFDQQLSAEISDSRRSGRPLTLAFCDLDRFKSINDSYGHPAGDAVLEGFARILLSELRQHDLACRYGGEEFALILRNTSEAEAAVVLERIRARLESHSWPLHPERAVTASFGIASWIGEEEGPAGLVARADAALYEAKSRGRNRVARHRATGHGSAGGVVKRVSA